MKFSRLRKKGRLILTNLLIIYKLIYLDQQCNQLLITADITLKVTVSQKLKLGEKKNKCGKKMILKHSES